MDNELDELLQQLGEVPTTQLVAAVAPESSVPLPAEDTPALDLRATVQRHEDISSEILGAWRADRAELQDGINVLRGIIDRSLAAGDVPTGTILEVFGNMLKNKADHSSNAIRLLDASAKLIAATKSQVSITNNNLAAATNPDLTAILANPVGDI